MSKWAKYAVFWVGHHEILWSKNKNHKFIKICTNVGGILAGVFVQYAQKSTVSRRIGAEAGTHTPPAVAHSTAARNARDGAKYSGLVIKHYSGMKRRETGERKALHSDTTYSGDSTTPPQDLVCANCTRDGSVGSPQDLVVEDSSRPQDLAEFHLSGDLGRPNVLLQSTQIARENRALVAEIRVVCCGWGVRTGTATGRCCAKCGLRRRGER